MITFNNGKILETISILGGTMQYQSASRATLEIRCSTKVVTFDELRALYTDAEALSELTVSEESVIQSVHLNYTLPVELKLTTVNNTEVYCMKLAQMSNLEIEQAKQADDIATNEAALIELAEIIAGGAE